MKLSVKELGLSLSHSDAYLAKFPPLTASDVACSESLIKEKIQEALKSFRTGLLELIVFLTIYVLINTPEQFLGRSMDILFYQKLIRILSFLTEHYIFKTNIIRNHLSTKSTVFVIKKKKTLHVLYSRDTTIRIYIHAET